MSEPIANGGETPVAYSPTTIEIIWGLPGKIAKPPRRAKGRSANYLHCGHPICCEQGLLELIERLEAQGPVQTTTTLQPSQICNYSEIPDEDGVMHRIEVPYICACFVPTECRHETVSCLQFVRTNFMSLVASEHQLVHILNVEYPMYPSRDQQ